MLQRLNSCYEFLRSDEIIDRVEFLRWAATTDNDNGLLIAILERLNEIREEGDLDEVLTRRETERVEPDRYRDKNLITTLCLLLRDFLEDLVLCGCRRNQDCRDFEWGKLDPVRLIRVYKYLKEMDGHVFNIHEAACLERTSKPRILSRFFHQVSARDVSEMEKEQQAEAKMIDFSILNVFLSFLAVATQIVFIVFIITEVISELADIFDGAEVKLLVSNCVIVTATVTVFLGFVLENYVGALKATRVIQSLRVRRAEYIGERLRRDFSLFLNLFGNGLLGYFLFYLNIPFVLSAETVTDAILNSLATVFLLEIDDRILPFQPAERLNLDTIDWDNDAVFENFIKIAHDYLYYKRDHRIPDAVDVAKVFKTVAQTKDNDLRLDFSALDYCRIYVDSYDENAKYQKITVFRLANEQPHPNIYEEIVYKISGPAAKEFVENVRYFKRIHFDDCDSSSEFSKKRCLRALGTRRTRKTILHAERSMQSRNRRYVKSFQQDGSESDLSSMSLGPERAEGMYGGGDDDDDTEVVSNEKAEEFEQDGEAAVTPPPKDEEPTPPPKDEVAPPPEDEDSRRVPPPASERTEI